MPKINSTRAGFVSADVTAATKTLSAADSGIVQDVKANTVITLPATALGLVYTFHVSTTAAGKAPTLAIAPNAADGVTGNGFTATVNKRINATSAQPGDLITLIGSGVTGVTGWTVAEAIGTWTRAA